MGSVARELEDLRDSIASIEEEIEDLQDCYMETGLETQERFEIRDRLRSLKDRKAVLESRLKTLKFKNGIQED